MGQLKRKIEEGRNFFTIVHVYNKGVMCPAMRITLLSRSICQLTSSRRSDAPSTMIFQYPSLNLISLFAPLHPPRRDQPSLPIPSHFPMLHHTLSAILVSVASRYAELSPSDVGIGIGGGRLVIDNVKLRAETLNSHCLPFHIYQGRAGRLRVNVPWSALSSSPVQLYLENIHLIAGPKQTSPTTPPSPAATPTTSAPATSPKAEWHQTLVGRLLFNVSVELYGLKVEYRDDDCIAVLSIASLKAFSAGSDWQIRFVSLVEDSDPDADDATTALAMRKLVKLSGVHCVMIPRLPSAALDNSVHSAPQFDRRSFESRAPILDGIPITVRVLLCTGTAYTQQSPYHVSAGLHVEVDIDLEDPHVSLTARQMVWIDRILKQGFGIGANPGMGANPAQTASPISALQPQQPALNTRRRPRPVPPELVNSSVQSANVKEAASPQRAAMPLLSDIESEHADGRLHAGYPPPPPLPPPSPGTENIYPLQTVKEAEHDLYRDEKVDDEIEKISDYDDENDYNDDRDPDVTLKSSGSGLLSLWRAIVSENGDDTIDDAAIALGLTNGDGVDNPGEQERILDAGEDQMDYFQARNAVEAAANAGGVTMQLRLKTPDGAAWDLVEKLKEDLRSERELRARLGGVETILEEAEERVRSSEIEAEQLRARNAALVQELEDLERMTSQAGKNKDAMIRQMEAALARAERSLQAMYQTEFGRQRGDHMVSPTEITESALREISVGGEPNTHGADTRLRKDHDNQSRVLSEYNNSDMESKESLQGIAEREQDKGTSHVELASKAGGRVNDLSALGVDSVVEEMHAEPIDEDEMISSRAKTEVAERGHVEETSYSGISSQQLEESFSWEGLTLI